MIHFLMVITSALKIKKPCVVKQTTQGYWIILLYLYNRLRRWRASCYSGLRWGGSNPWLYGADSASRQIEHQCNRKKSTDHFHVIHLHYEALRRRFPEFIHIYIINTSYIPCGDDHGIIIQPAPEVLRVAADVSGEHLQYTGFRVQNTKTGEAVS